MNRPVALITGAAKRIGAALTAKFHGAGYRVILHCNHSTHDAETLAGELNDIRADSAKIITLDLTAAQEFHAFTEQCLSYFGQIDVLINNASVFYPTRTSSVTTAEFDELINVNLRAPYFLSTTLRAVLSGGSIINIIDIYGERPLKGFSAYSISKAGLAMATRALALEFAPDIRVNGISPGAILWPEGDAGSEKNWQALVQEIPLSRIGEPEDIADTALFLAKSSYITGEIISVDGGSLVK